MQNYRFSKSKSKNEWENYHRIRKEQIFDSINISYDKNHSTIHAKNHFHFVLYFDSKIVCAAHIEFLDEKYTAALRSLSTDEQFKNRGHGKKMMKFLEKWLKTQNIKFLKMHARLSAENFYRKLGYNDCMFDDQCISKKYINLGKKL